MMHWQSLALTALILVIPVGCYEKAESFDKYHSQTGASSPVSNQAEPAPVNPVDKETTPDAAEPITKTEDPTKPAAKPSPPAPNTSSSPASGTTMVSFTPVRYAAAQYPAFVFAIWITDANNRYIKTIGAQAATRMRYLDKWLTAAGVTAPTQPDGVSGASITYPATAAPITVTWDMKDKAGVFVPQGAYTINFQMTSANNTGLSLTIPVTISSTGMTKTDTSMATGLTAVSIKHSP